jgi:hypothetical protein
MPYPSAPFEQNYRCYSASFIDKVMIHGPQTVVNFSSFVWSVYLLEAYGRMFSLLFFTYLLENHNTCHWNVGDSRIWKMVIKVWDEQPCETFQCIEVHVFWICLELGLHFVMERANGCVFNAVWWSWLWVYFSGHASFSSRSLGYILQSVLQLLIPYDCQEFIRTLMYLYKSLVSGFL